MREKLFCTVCPKSNIAKDDAIYSEIEHYLYLGLNLMSVELINTAVRNS